MFPRRVHCALSAGLLPLPGSRDPGSRDCDVYRIRSIECFVSRKSMNSCKFSENCVPIWPAVQELWPKTCPCKERFFCCSLSFVGSTVFEWEQTVRNLSYHGNTWKCAEFCSKSPKITFLSHVFARRRAAGLLPAPSWRCRYVAWLL